MLPHIPLKNRGKVKRTQASRIQIVIVAGILFSLLLLNTGVAAAGTDVKTQPAIQTLNVTPAVTLQAQPANGTAVIQTLVVTPAPVVQAPSVQNPVVPDPVLQQAAIDNKVMLMHNVTTAQRFAAAKYAAEQAAKSGYNINSLTPPGPGATPHYFGPYANYANSQLPSSDGLGNVTAGTGIRKFVDSLPGLGIPNNLGQYIPVAKSDTSTYPGADYYEIGLVQYDEKMHSDINVTLLRGYVQIETAVNRGTSRHVGLFYPNSSPILNATGGQVFAYDNPHYLGPLISANRNIPVRIKFQNYLPTGTDGNLFIPVDDTVMGAGPGPNGGFYTENRATIHLHGGNTPWISDGTPHQWTTPAGENTPYPVGVSVKYVPDMDGGNEPAGTLTFYYTNQQSARLMFYHDHAYGITRLNVYAGEAAGYVIRDTAEQGLKDNGSIPSDEIPLIIQDKSFVPDATQVNATDPTWQWGNLSTPWPHTGSLWYNHVYMPLQNPSDPTNTNAMGRWDYGPWFWPPFTGFLHQPVVNPYFGQPGEPLMIPATPNPSVTPESFMDTMVVNGAVYPYVQVGQHAYRFRILNAANDRTLNLGLYYAGSNATMWSGMALSNGSAGEVNMVPANATLTPGLPADWPTDDRAGGVPDPTARGPAWIQIGTEGGFMPAPAVIPPRPVDYDLNHQYGGVVNIKNSSLLLMPAQRADVIVNFTGIPDGTKLILYNDAPAPAPGGDTRYDYYTGDPNQTPIGGAPTTFAGYAPNTRTIMQIQINSSIAPTGPAWNMTNLTAQLPAAYAQFQDKPIVPESAYNTAFNANYPDHYVNLTNTSMTFIPAVGTLPATLPIRPKAIIGDFDMEYGRLTALLGVEIPRTSTNIEARVPYGYVDPPTEIFSNSVNTTLIGSLSDGTQIWRVRNVDVDLHPLHWHMFNLQVLNRVIWDGTVVPPDASEQGWRETVSIPPLTDTIVAMRPITPDIPWELPNSIHMLNPALPAGALQPFTGLDPTRGQALVTNHMINYGWEYVYHCHILGHEEFDFMRPMPVAVAPAFPPTNLTAGWFGPNTTPHVRLTWKDNSVAETHWSIQRSLNLTNSSPWIDIARSPSSTGPQKGGFATYDDAAIAPNTSFFNTRYSYRVLATNWVGDTTVYPNSIGYPNMAVNSTPSGIANVTQLNATKIGVFRNSTLNTTLFLLDYNGNGAWNGAVVDRQYRFGISGDLPVSGNWNNNRTSKIGVFRNSTHMFYLDYDGNGTWNATLDRQYNFGLSGDKPVAGDWNNDGRSEIGVFRNSTHMFYLDYDGNGTWNGAVVDRQYNFGLSGDKPVVGDWDNDGISEIGVARNTTNSTLFYLDYNGNGVWNGAVVDRQYTFGLNIDLPVSGDWNNDGTSEIGTFRNSTKRFYLDYNGNGVWNGTVIDRQYTFGLANDTPVSGRWS
jgi:FtsP/CotA-like multicopper oxidase with cupredoxin domain